MYVTQILFFVKTRSNAYRLIDVVVVVVVVFVVVSTLIYVGVGRSC